MQGGVCVGSEVKRGGEGTSAAANVALRVSHATLVERLDQIQRRKKSTRQSRVDVGETTLLGNIIAAKPSTEGQLIWWMGECS
ncbi:unnamed protein product [Caretta caretta]